MTNAAVVGQNFFTPSIITTTQVDSADRPFAGLLYGGARVDFTDDDYRAPWIGLQRKVQHSLEVDVGVLGAPAMAGPTQSAVHVLRESRIPKGWDEQIGFEPALQVGWQSRMMFKRGWFNLVPHVGFGLGNVQTFVNAGATLKLGTVEGFPSLLNPLSVDPLDEPRFRFALLAGFEWRQFAHNAYVDGPLFGENLAIESKHSVPEWRLGFMTEFRTFGLNYSFVHREPEFVTPAHIGDGKHRFGSLNLSWRMDRALTSNFPGRSWFKRDWIAEATVASAHSKGGSPVYGGAETGIGMRFGLSKGVTEHILVGGEVSGTVRSDETPDSQGFHDDVFLNTKGFTVGVRPLGRERIVMLRAGYIWGHSSNQHIRGDERDYTVKATGEGTLFGASAGFHLHETLGLAMDVVWTDYTDRNDSLPMQYVLWGLGLKWLP